MNKNIKKPVAFKIITFFSASVAIYIVYYLLLQGTYCPFSISSLICLSQKLTIQKHLLIVGLLPLYITFMISAGALIGFYLGKLLNKLFHHLKNNKWLTQDL